jgi:hypothetical protein
MQRFLHAALAAPVLALAACGGDTPSARTPANPADTLAYTMRAVQKESGTCRASATDSTTVPCLKVDIAWPELEGDSARAGEARAFIHRLVAASFQNGTDLGTPDSVLGEMLTVHALMGTAHKGGYNTPWLLERKVDVVCNEPRALGIRVVSRQRTGGPHALTATRYAQFDAVTGAPLGLGDLVRKGKDDELRRAAAAAWKRQKQEQKALGTAKVNPDSFPMPRTAIACGDSLLLQYDVIQMGPHSVRDAQVVLGAEALKGLRKD